MRKKILVVDNHPMILKFMTDLLKKEGHNVLSAEDGLTALQVLETQIPDIMFIDLIMPNITGEKLCRIIRNDTRFQDVYICILSAIAAEQEVDCTEFGANACIAKGPLNKMAKHVFFIMKRAELGSVADKDANTIGCEDVYKRHITKELLSTKRHFELILSNMSQGILELTMGGQIVYANSVALSLMAITEEKLLGSKFTELFSDPYKEYVNEIFTHIKDEPRFINEESPVKLNGKQVTLTVLPVKDEQNLSLIVIMDDIDEKKRMKAQIMQAQKMKAIATLAGGIAHEFNNALQGITGNIDLLQVNLKDTDKLDTYIDPMNNSIERMNNLTSQLLAYAQGGKYQLRIMPFNIIVEDTLTSIRHSLDPNIKIKTDLSPDTHDVEADLTQMQMVLLAIITNAAEAIEGSGTIQITTGNREITIEFAKDHLDVKPGLYVALGVIDTGEGMDEVTLRRIFEPFFTTKFQGRGFGMAAVYGIIKNHGGWISVDSRPNHGTSVHVYLPAVEHIKRTDEEVSSEIRGGSETILVIEDEEPVLQVSKDMLEALGYRVLEASSGKEASDIAESYEGDIDVALLDIGLPDMKGEKAFELLKEARPHIKVILCSGYSIEGPAQDIIKSGANGFIQKPYTLAVLSTKLQEIIGFKKN